MGGIICQWWTFFFSRNRTRVENIELILFVLSSSLPVETCIIVSELADKDAKVGRLLFHYFLILSTPLLTFSIIRLCSFFIFSIFFLLVVVNSITRMVKNVPNFASSFDTNYAHREYIDAIGEVIFTSKDGQAEVSILYNWAFAVKIFTFEWKREFSLILCALHSYQ